MNPRYSVFIGESETAFATKETYARAEAVANSLIENKLSKPVKIFKIKYTLVAIIDPLEEK
jgi:hypothetical protein